MLQRLAKRLGRATLVPILAAYLGLSMAWAGTVLADDAEKSLRQWPRGICVLISDSPAETAIALAGQSELTFYVQLPDATQVAETRRQISDAGLLGSRIYVEQGPWSHIHLADNLADVVLVDDDMASRMAPYQEEMLRVVRPLGKVLCDGVLTKPYPAEADDWTHPYHGPDNNPQSTDALAQGALMTQFYAAPHYVPFPEVTVTAGGRLFRAFGHVGYKERDWPWLNTLVAFNGYNGTLLWKRSLQEGFNIHRNTMVATPDILYLADSTSCKLLDTATGELIDEIFAPSGAAGSVWKWMAIHEDTLYALVGEEEYQDETLRGDRTMAGWPWKPMTSGYDSEDYGWGFGRTLFAVNLKTKKVRWQQTEQQAIDGRAVAMRGERIYYYSHSNFLGCLDGKSGERLWKNEDSELLEAIGPHDRSQSPRLGFSSSAYLKCSDEAIYFAGPQRLRLVAASTEDGRLLWQLPHGNFQLVLRDEGLYAMGRTGASLLLDPLSGETLDPLAAVRGNCTRATGTIDSIFSRGQSHGGTLRLTVPDHQARRIAVMRPDCHDGVIAAGGMLHWGPWMCDCSLSLVGSLTLCPAGDFQFEQEAVEAERLETAMNASVSLEELTVTAADWPTYRSDNQRNAMSPSEIPTEVDEGWHFTPPEGVNLTAPVMVGHIVFVGGSDGVVRAMDANSGEPLWQAYTAGSILYPPTIDANRLFVGSGDGWIYAFEAASGRQLWRFRAAPVERKISLYGRLTSTWPVASGVLASDGVVYAAAGIASYDGTHVYALDAATGHIRWQNNTSGNMVGEDGVTGVSVQGHLLLHENRLYLAGGNVVSPAVYDIEDGRCLNTLSDEWGGQKIPSDAIWNDPAELRQFEMDQKDLGKSPRGCELFLVEGQVVAFDRLLYSPEEFWKGRYFSNSLAQAGPEANLVRAMGDRLTCLLPRGTAEAPKAQWDLRGIETPMAMAVAANAVVMAGSSKPESDEDETYEVAARSLDDGSILWTRPIASPPKWWGIAIDRSGRVVVTLQDGALCCFE